MSRHVEAMLEFQRRGAIVFDYGNNLTAAGKGQRCRECIRLSGVCACLHPPAVLRGQRAVSLGRSCRASSEDIYKTDEAIMNLFPDNDHLARWLTMAQEKVEFQGLPARICWLGYGERAKAGSSSTKWSPQRRAKSADRHRPRSSRLRIGRLAKPRDRSDERRHLTPSPIGSISTR